MQQCQPVQLRTLIEDLDLPMRIGVIFVVLRPHKDLRSRDAVLLRNDTPSEKRECTGDHRAYIMAIEVVLGDSELRSGESRGEVGFEPV